MFILFFIFVVMFEATNLKQKLLSKHFSFESLVFEVFYFQYKYNNIYRKFVDLNKININEIKKVEEIPFLPIQFFKTHQICTQSNLPSLYFESSGTTQTINAKHYIVDEDLYQQNFMKGFQQFFGNIEDYNIIALLPNYLERQHSSLVYMFNHLIQLTKSNLSGFYLDDFHALNQTLQKTKVSSKKTILLGVTYALLDFAAAYPQDLSHCIVMETGGMKGRKKEMTKYEVHEILKQAFSIDDIFAEYGMTELLSQAYSLKDGIYFCADTMRVFSRDIYNPKAFLHEPKRGVLNVIDLANIYSCAFIETQDVGIVYNHQEFEIIGRLDNSDIRGCNLMLH
jgi:hypothetical protein